MNDDELRSALARRASRSLSAEKRNDILRAARLEAKEPNRRSLAPRFYGWLAAAAAVIVLVLITLPVLLSPPHPVAQASSSPGVEPTPALATADSSTRPVPTAPPRSPDSSALPVYSAQELVDRIGKPEWVGKALLVDLKQDEIQTPTCPQPTDGFLGCGFANLKVGNDSYQVKIGVIDAPRGMGAQIDDGQGYRWVTSNTLPRAGLNAFTVGSCAHCDDLEFLGPVQVSMDGSPIAIADAVAAEPAPDYNLYAVDGWLGTTPPAPCAFPPEGQASPHPDISSYYCGGSWLAAREWDPPTSGLTVDGALHVQGDAYSDFAPNPVEGMGEPGNSREGIYLIRNAGCPEVVTGDCPVWRMAGRIDQASPSSSPAPWPSVSLDPGSLAVAIQTQQSPDGACVPDALIGQLVSDATWGLAVRTNKETIVGVVWPFGFSAMRDGDEIRLLDANGDVAAKVGDNIIVGGGPGTVNPFQACLQVEVAPPSPTPSGSVGYSTADLGDISFEYPSGWTLNQINELQHYAATLAFISSETASATASCGPDYQPGFGGPCDHSFEVPEGSMVVQVTRFTLPGNGMQTIAADIGRGAEPAMVNGMAAAYFDPFSDATLPSVGHSVAWKFAQPGDTIGTYTIIVTDNGYANAADVLNLLLSTVTVTSPYDTETPIEQETAEQIARSFFLGVHGSQTVGDWSIKSVLETDDVSGRSAWQIEINAPVTEATGVTYTSAYMLSIDAVTGAVRVVGQD